VAAASSGSIAFEGEGPERFVDMSGKRISVELPEHLVDRLDQLRKEWHARSRGACLERLLEEIFESDAETISPEPAVDGAATPIQVTGSDGNDPVYDEDRAIVLVGSHHHRSGSPLEEPVPTPSPPPRRSSGSNGGGIDLPGFVRNRTAAIRSSLEATEASVDAPVVPSISASQLQAWSDSALQHWMSLYGSSPGDTVMDAVMLWMARDIWPQIDGSEGRAFTWSQVKNAMDQICGNWPVQSPRFEHVIVAAAVLEDPFATATVIDRIPTLIRRFVNRFKRSRKVTSFETLESTMTLHGALRQLELPTQAGHSLTLRTIRDAYKRKAVEVHPDSGGSTEAMRRLNEAYQMLKELYRQKDQSQE